MQETEFIEQKKARWSEFESILQSDVDDPERITDLFIQTTDDLSYSRTFYNNRSVRVYLNGIAQQAYQLIYKNKKRKRDAFRTFWSQELPDLFWHHRKALYFSLIVFGLGILIGLVSSMFYPDFERIILGDDYINMTKQNIENGTPMGVYGKMDELPMFFEIALNNIRVSYIVFVLGLTLGVGTLYMILYNAIMVGTFVYFFIERDLFRECFLAIMLHGTLELSMIVVAGAAGFAMAQGLIFPGTYSRTQALIQSSKNAGKMMIAVTILLIYAAFIESFLTRHTDMGDTWRVLIIILSFALVAGYFFILPWYRFKQGKTKPLVWDELPKTKEPSYQLHLIKNAGRIFTESFNLLKGMLASNLIYALIVGVSAVSIFGIIMHGDYFSLPVDNEFYEEDLSFFYPWLMWDNYLDFDRFPLVVGVMALLHGIFMTRQFGSIINQFGKKRKLSFNDYITGIAISILLAMILRLPHAGALSVMVIAYPFCLIWMYTSMWEKQYHLLGLNKTVKLVWGNLSVLLGTFFSSLSVFWIFLFLISSPVLNFVVEFITMNVPSTSPIAKQIPNLLEVFFLFSMGAFGLGLFSGNAALQYHSFLETVEAPNLMKHIQEIGIRKRAYGLEKES